MLEDRPELDRVYRALGDPTRRRLMEMLGQGEARISDLATPIPLTFAAVARHVALLEEAGLISRDVRGREHWLTVRPEGLRDAESWIADQAAQWRARADALAKHLEASKRR
jgi:DNA-binding transcriptional ArsR family regulator